MTRFQEAQPVKKLKSKKNQWKDHLNLKANKRLYSPCYRFALYYKSDLLIFLSLTLSTYEAIWSDNHNFGFIKLSNWMTRFQEVQPVKKLMELRIKHKNKNKTKQNKNIDI